MAILESSKTDPSDVKKNYFCRSNIERARSSQNSINFF